MKIYIIQEWEETESSDDLITDYPDNMMPGIITKAFKSMEEAKEFIENSLGGKPARDDLNLANGMWGPWKNEIRMSVTLESYEFWTMKKEYVIMELELA